MLVIAYHKRKGESMSEMRVRNAMIEEIYTDRGTTFVTIIYRNRPSEREERVKLVVNRDTRIVNEEGRRIAVRDLEEGMRVDATFSEAMTRSIPPQAQAISIRVKEPIRRMEVTFGRVLEVNTREKFILVMRNQNLTDIIRFNVGDETRIEDIFGRRIRLSQLVPGLRVRVEHADFMTASIPPQSPAYEIRMIR